MKIRFTEIMSAFIIVVQLHSLAVARIEGSPHDLSALSGQNACGFCHTPHQALPRTPASWSHKLSDSVYTIYQSSSLDANVGQPTGSSKMCLSCHDGTVALTHTTKGGAGGIYITPGSANLSTDLSEVRQILVQTYQTIILSVLFILPLCQQKMFKYGHLQHYRSNLNLTA
jgi:cytochrome c551/c552